MIFDELVIGSSPLLQLYAVQAARKGLSICLVEKPGTACWAGAWSCDNQPNVGPIETACHLIEFYGNSYELLEDLAGHKFLPVEPQPVWINPDQSPRPYSSKWGIVRNSFRSVVRLPFSVVIQLMRQSGLIFRSQDDTRQKSSVSQRLSKCRSQISGQLFYCWKFKGVFGPSGGHQEFIASLQSQLGLSGVTIMRTFATHANFDDTQRSWTIESSENAALSARKIVIGDSTSLSISYGDGHEIALSPKYAVYTHCLYSTDRDSVLIHNPYIQLPRDPLVHRISFLKSSEGSKGEDKAILLVQLRKKIEILTSESEAVENVLKDYSILSHSAELTHINEFSRPYVASSPEPASLEPFPENTIQHIRTHGDLARNLFDQRSYFLNEKL